MFPKQGEEKKKKCNEIERQKMSTEVAEHKNAERKGTFLRVFPLRLFMQYLLLHHAVIWLPVK